PTRSEELQNWQRPIDLVTPMAATFARLGWGGDGAREGAVAPANTAADGPDSDESLLASLLADDPIATLAHLERRVQVGAAPTHLAQRVALAAAHRILRFHVQNDFSDWISVLHTFTHAHAVHACLRRGAAPIVGRAIMHGAMQVYLDRFLNIPQASLPRGDRARKQGYTAELDELLNLLNSQQQVACAGDWVAHYLDAGGDVPELFNALGHALLREDAEFHSFQMYEAAVTEYDWWGEDDTEFALQARRTIILALTRYLAAHAPTARELPNIVRIAWRLQHGEKLFESEDNQA
ncbi:MAG: Rieske (2Fe-2S) protein, partial [Firmicutes bacterium]|nr:Rieske (2Fe-2S) protein [Bacillota bacterium]